jgi:hypothetical protein
MRSALEAANQRVALATRWNQRQQLNSTQNQARNQTSKKLTMNQSNNLDATAMPVPSANHALQVRSTPMQARRSTIARTEVSSPNTLWS